MSSIQSTYKVDKYCWWLYLITIHIIKFSMRRVSVATPTPNPRTKNAPTRSSILIDDLWVKVAFCLLLTKHFGAVLGTRFFIQNEGKPVSHSSIRLHRNLNGIMHASRFLTIVEEFKNIEKRIMKQLTRH